MPIKLYISTSFCFIIPGKTYHVDHSKSSAPVADNYGGDYGTYDAGSATSYAAGAGSGVAEGYGNEGVDVTSYDSTVNNLNGNNGATLANGLPPNGPQPGLPPNGLQPLQAF